MTNVPEFGAEGYPYYETGMILPDGVFPPLEGYTHEALIEEACSLAYEYLIAKNVNTTLAKETVFSIGALINGAFEKEYVEYELATYSQKPYENSEPRIRSIEGMAADFSIYASRAVIDAINDSPIRVIGEEARVGLVRCIRHGIRDRILTLINEPFAINDSPIRPIEEEARVGLVRCICRGIRDRILTLINKPSTIKR